MGYRKYRANRYTRCVSGERCGIEGITQADTLKDRAFRALKAAILSRKLTPGTIYSENQLARELAISRTPVREALAMLAAQGFVRSIPQRGVEVVSYSQDDIREILQLREAIDGYVVERLARELHVDLSDLYQLLDEMAADADSGDITGLLEKDRLFHDGLVAKLGNSRIAQVNMGALAHLHRLGLEAMDAPGRARAVIDEHRAILDAVKNRNPVRAKAAVLDHMYNTLAAMERFN